MTDTASPIQYRIEVADAHAHRFQLTLRIARPQSPQRLSLPVWIPGSYLVREFARHLSPIFAKQGGRAHRPSEPLQERAPAPSKWRRWTRRPGRSPRGARGP